jgi:hypothetical protein
MKMKSTKNHKLPMSFIVRVYRFVGEGPEGIVGVVETVGDGEERGFTGIEELWEILASAGKRGKGRKPKGGSHVKQV